MTNLNTSTMYNAAVATVTGTSKLCYTKRHDRQSLAHGCARIRESCLWIEKVVVRRKLIASRTF